MRGYSKEGITTERDLDFLGMEMKTARNNTGSSIMMALVGASVASILAVGVSEALIRTQTMQSRTAAHADLEDEARLLELALTDQANCKANLVGLSPSPLVVPATNATPAEIELKLAPTDPAPHFSATPSFSDVNGFRFQSVSIREITPPVGQVLASGHTLSEVTIKANRLSDVQRGLASPKTYKKSIPLLLKLNGSREPIDCIGAGKNAFRNPWTDLTPIVDNSTGNVWVHPSMRFNPPLTATEIAEAALIPNVGYYKDRQGIVHLRGALSQRFRFSLWGTYFGTCWGAPPSNPYYAFTARRMFLLPPEARPAKDINAKVSTKGGLARITVQADGSVFPNGTGCNGQLVSLDGISFRAGI